MGTQSQSRYAGAAREVAVHQQGLEGVFWDMQNACFRTAMPDQYLHMTMPDPTLAQCVPGERVDTPQCEMYGESTPIHHEYTEESFESLCRSFPGVEGSQRASSLGPYAGAVNNEEHDSTLVSNFKLRYEEKEYQVGESNYPQGQSETVSFVVPLAIFY